MKINNMDYKEKVIALLNSQELSKEQKEKLEGIFPELRESEDERIRKTLIEYFNAYPKDYYGELKKSHILAWLEKQNHDGKKWIYEDVYLKEKEQLIQDGIDEVLENPQKYGLEKQGEQNPYSGVSFKYNGHTFGMCARDGGAEILMDGNLKAFVSSDKSFVYPVNNPVFTIKQRIGG